MKNNIIKSAVCLVLVAAVCIASSAMFAPLYEPSEIRPSENMTEVRRLSEYHGNLANTNGDTDIYVFEGEKAGGSVLILGGTHPNEPAGHLAAVVMIEKLNVDAGTVYVIPRANNSAFGYNDPGEASPLYVHFTNPNGEVRQFRYGSRATSPTDQWPDNDTYIHEASGQTLNGAETRNLNRGYPGVADGSLTEQICYGIVQLIKEEEIDIVIDLHEASPEYPNNHSMVAHENAMAVASLGMMKMQLEGMPIKLESSPKNLHGLSHREIGDYTNAMSILIETPNPSHGRVRGATNEHIAITGEDKAYLLLSKHDLLYVPYDENGAPIENRVGYHLSAVQCLLESMAERMPEKAIELNGLPSYSEMKAGYFGDYLN